MTYNPFCLSLFLHCGGLFYCRLPFFYLICPLSFRLELVTFAIPLQILQNETDFHVFYKKTSEIIHLWQKVTLYQAYAKT